MCVIFVESNHHFVQHELHLTDAIILFGSSRLPVIAPSDLPPLDERGIPKYTGKKRGRKPKLRKRKVNPDRRRRQHTAYTLFVQERYQYIKALQPGQQLTGKNLIATIAKEWASVTAEEKKEWKKRAQQTHDSVEDEDDDVIDEEGVTDEEEVFLGGVTGAQAEDEDNDEDDEAAPPVRRLRRRA